MTDPLLAAISGTEVSNNYGNQDNEALLTLSTSSNIFTIQFKSDSLNSRAGYELIWSCPVASIDEIDQNGHSLSVFPNPVFSGGWVSITNTLETPETYQLMYPGGGIIAKGRLTNGMIEIPDEITGLVILRL